MAKKSSKKPAPKPAPKAIKKVAKKAPAKKAPAAKSASKGPAKVTSGSGASPAELGAKLVALFNQNKADEWIQTVWDKGVRSIEGDGGVHVGAKAILEKWAWWISKSQVLGASAEGPYVGANAFAVKFTMHVRDKESGQDMHMTETAVYTVKNGKIVEEQFMYYMA
jgi:hypothetical protein